MWRNNQPKWPPLVALVATATGLRLWELTKESLWLDEVYTLLDARLPVREILVHRFCQDHPPLHFIASRPFVTLFGPDTGGVRMLPVLEGVLGVCAMVWLGTIWFQGEEPGKRWRLAYWTGLLTAFHPFHLHYSRDGRMYAFQFLGAAVSLGLLLRLINAPAKREIVRHSLLLGLVNAVGLYFSYFFALVIGLESLILTAFALRSQKEAKWTAVLMFFGTSMVTSLPALHEFYPTIRQVLDLSSESIRAVPAFQLTKGFWENLLYRWGGGEPLAEGRSVFIIPWIFAGLLLSGLLPARRPLQFLAVFWITAPGFVWRIFNPDRWFEVRYFMFILPVVILLAVRGFGVFVDLLPCLRGRLLSGVLLVSLMIPSDILVYQGQSEQNWKGVGKTLATLVKPGDLVLVEPSHVLPAVSWGLAAAGCGVETSALMALESVEALASERPGNQLWVVYSGHTWRPKGMEKFLSVRCVSIARWEADPAWRSLSVWMLTR